MSKFTVTMFKKTRFQVEDLVWIFDRMSNTPGHENLADRGYRTFLRQVEIVSISFATDVLDQKAGINVTHYDIEEPGVAEWEKANRWHPACANFVPCPETRLGYSKFWSDSNVFASQEEAFEAMEKQGVNVW